MCKLVEELRKQYPELPVAKRSRRQASICSTLNAIESERLNSINPERKRCIISHVNEILLALFFFLKIIMLHTQIIRAVYQWVNDSREL